MNTITLYLLFSAASVQFNLPEGLLASLCYVESTHNINAIHHDDGGSDSLGVCQIKYETAQWLGFNGTREQLMNPTVNIYYSAKYLSYQQRRYNGDLTNAVIAYNMGSTRGFVRTKYSDKVMNQWKFYINAKGIK